MACELVQSEAEAEMPWLTTRRDRLVALLEAGFEALVVHGDPANRLPNTASVAFTGIEASTLVCELGDEVAVSAGAACHSDGVHVSHVLDAMGIDADLARATVRLSVGRFTTTDEVERAARLILSRINV